MLGVWIGVNILQTKAMERLKIENVYMWEFHILKNYNEINLVGKSLKHLFQVRKLPWFDSII